MRGQVKARFPEALEWPPIGLPEDYFPLLAPGRPVNQRLCVTTERPVCHGGAIS